MRKPRLLVGLLLLAMSLRVGAQTPVSDAFVVTHANLIDGTGAPPMENVTAVGDWIHLKKDSEA